MSGFPQFQAPVTLTNTIPTNVPFTIKGAAGQSSDLLDILDSTSTKRDWIDASGNHFNQASGNTGFVKIGQGGAGGNAGAAINWNNNSSIDDENTGGSDLIIRTPLLKIAGVGAGTIAIQWINVAGTGVGNGASTNLTALAKGTGAGPASDVVNTWVPENLNGTAGFRPFFV